MSGTWMSGCWLPSNDQRLSSSIDLLERTTYSIDVCNSFSTLSSMVSQIHCSSLESPSGMDNKENENMSQPVDKKKNLYVDETELSSVVASDDCSVVCMEPDSSSQIDDGYPVQVVNEECSLLCEPTQVPSAVVLSCINDASVDAKKNGFRQMYETSGEAVSKDSSMPKLERVDHCNTTTPNLEKEKKCAKGVSKSPVMPTLEKQTSCEMDNLKFKSWANRRKCRSVRTVCSTQSKHLALKNNCSSVRTLRQRSSCIDMNCVNGESVLNLKQSSSILKHSAFEICMKGTMVTAFWSSDPKIGKECVLIEKMDPRALNFYVSSCENNRQGIVNTDVAERLVTLRKRKTAHNNESSQDQNSEEVSGSKRKKMTRSKKTQKIKPLSQKPHPCNFCNSKQLERNCLPKRVQNLQMTQIIKKRRTSKRQKVKKGDSFSPGKKSFVHVEEYSRNTVYNFRQLRSSSNAVNASTLKTAMQCSRNSSGSVSKLPAYEPVLSYLHKVRDQRNLSNRKVKNGREQRMSSFFSLTRKVCSKTGSLAKKSCQYSAVKEHFRGKLSHRAYQLLETCKTFSIRLYRLEQISPKFFVANPLSSHYKNTSCVHTKNALAISAFKCETISNADLVSSKCNKSVKLSHVQSAAAIPVVKCEPLKGNIDHGVSVSYCEKKVCVNDQKCNSESDLHLNPVNSCVVSQADSETSKCGSFDNDQMNSSQDVCKESKTVENTSVFPVINNALNVKELKTFVNHSAVQKHNPLTKPSGESTLESEASVSRNPTESGNLSNMNVTVEPVQMDESEEFLWCSRNLTNFELSDASNCDVETPDKSVRHFCSDTIYNLDLNTSFQERTLNICSKKVLNEEGSCGLPNTTCRSSGKNNLLVHLTDSINHSSQESFNNISKCAVSETCLKSSNQRVSHSLRLCSEKELNNQGTVEFSGCSQVLSSNNVSVIPNDVYAASCGAASLTSLPNSRSLISSNQNCESVGNDPYFEFPGSEKRAFPDYSNFASGGGNACDMQSLFLQDGSCALNRALNFTTKSTHLGGDSCKRDVDMSCIVSSRSVAIQPSHEDQPPCSQLADQDLYGLEFDNLFDDIVISGAADNSSNGGSNDLLSEPLITSNNIGNNLDPSSSLNIFDEIDAGILYPNVGGNCDESLAIQENLLGGEENARLSEILSYLKESSL